MIGQHDIGRMLVEELKEIDSLSIPSEIRSLLINALKALAEKTGDRNFQLRAEEMEVSLALPKPTSQFELAKARVEADFEDDESGRNKAIAEVGELFLTETYAELVEIREVRKELISVLKVLAAIEGGKDFLAEVIEMEKADLSTWEASLELLAQQFEQIQARVDELKEDE